MSKRDKEIGMHRRIDRRDFLQGAGALASTAVFSGDVLAQQILTAEPELSRYYPPKLTGLRGSHTGSYEIAHKLAREGKRNWGPVTSNDSQIYDLVVVGAGVSGLSAAYFYLKEHPEASVLLLDNHDDFGGHAKRNEFTVEGEDLISYGGSQTFEAPSQYSAITKSLLADLEIDTKEFEEAYNHDFYQRHKLEGAVFFDRENWGKNQVVKNDLGGLRFTMPLAEQSQSTQSLLNQMPISNAARKELATLLNHTEDVFKHLSLDKRYELLGSISYQTYLTDYLGISESEVFALLEPLTTDLGAGIDAVPAIDAITYVGLPGLKASGLPKPRADEPYIHHFPDGNASLTRMLVRKMIPRTAPGNSMHDIVLADFDYDKLDLANQPVRIRLNSTVVNVQHEGTPKSAKTVAIDYVHGTCRGRIRARNCVLACYNAIIPSLCSELPEAQKTALTKGVKVPLVYTNVALTNWRAFSDIGVGAISAPSSYHVNAMLDFPVSMGGYKYSDNPDKPVVVHMERFPHVPNKELSKRQQVRLGRHELYSTPFENIERNTREQLAAMLAQGDFDPARDIAAITVNRWPHGYASNDWLESDWYENRDDPRYWYVEGRQTLGRIAIANTDAGARATVDEAVKQADRAVKDLL